jgi:hypothetical protein
MIAMIAITILIGMTATMVAMLNAKYYSHDSHDYHVSHDSDDSHGDYDFIVVMIVTIVMRGKSG